MYQETVSTSQAPEVIIEEVQGSLQVKGWENSNVEVRANVENLTLEEKDDVVHVRCQGNCSVRLPSDSSLQVEKVLGEASIKLLEDQLSIEQVNGPLNLRNVADTRVEKVNGNLVAKHVVGDLSVENVAGNAKIRDIEGNCVLEEVSGNLDLREVDGGINVQVSGNARLRLNIIAGELYQVSAKGNLHCRIPEDAGVHIKLSSASQVIKINLPNHTKNFQGQEYELTLGDGSVPMQISADGMIFLSGEESDRQTTQEDEIELGEEFQEMAGALNQQIAQQVQAEINAMTLKLNQELSNLVSGAETAGLSEDQTEEIIRSAREAGERAAARAQEKMRRAQEKLQRKLEANRRRSELRARAAEKRAQARDQGASNFEWPWSQTERQESISEEERLMILRMLEQKKISLQEAEQLLDALEGKSS
jgi:hypothetical protein